MRILITGILSTWAPKYGGGQVLTHQLASGLAKAGHDVQAIYTRCKGQMLVEANYPIAWVRHSSHILVNSIPVARQAASMHARYGFDLCHFTGVEGALAPAWVNDLPCVYSEYYPHLPSKRELKILPCRPSDVRRLIQNRYFHVARILAKRSTHVIVPSHFAARQVEDTYGVNRGKITAIPWGIDASLFEQRTYIRREGIVWLARVDRSKGFDVLLEAFAKVIEKGFSCTLTFIGAGDTEAAKRLAFRLGVGDRTAFLGQLPLSEYAKVLGRNKIFVLPSRVESFGGVLLDAMASRLAIIASDVGGIPEVVKHGETALLVKPGDPDSLCEALERLLREPALTDALAENGYKHLQKSKCYTWSDFIHSHCRIYERIAGL